MTAPIIFPKGVPVGYIFSYGARRWKKTASDPDVWDSLTTTDALVERAESAAYDAEAAKQAAEAAAEAAEQAAQDAAEAGAEAVAEFADELAKPDGASKVGTGDGGTVQDAISVAESPADLISSTKEFTPGAYIRTADGHIYKVASPDAEDHQVETAGGVKLYVLPDANGFVAVEAFGVLTGAAAAANLEATTAAMQSAWDYSMLTGHKIQYATGNLDSPYYVGRGLKMRNGMQLYGVWGQTYVVLHSSQWGGSGWFIEREDDGLRYYRGVIEGVSFATALSSVSAAQDSNQTLGGMSLAACEAWVLSNVFFMGFGQGGVVLARAEGGDEGLGMYNTFQDGNYNQLRNVHSSACGRYRSNEQERAGVVLLYKANSNSLDGIYCRGNPNSSALAIVYGGNNNVAHLTGESCEYSVRFGWGAINNEVFNPRGEGVTNIIKGYEVTLANALDSNGKPIAFNTVYGYHQSTGGGPDLDEGHNVKIAGTSQFPLSYRRPLGTSAGTITYGLIDVLGAKTRPDEPFYIMATLGDETTSTDATCVPVVRFRNNYLGPTAGYRLAGIEFENRDNSGGAAGVSAAIDAVMEGTGGQTALVLKTGTGTTMGERFRISSAGVPIIAGDTFRVVGERTIASATATGTKGDICWDANYIYVCVATNTWKRTALESWS